MAVSGSRHGLHSPHTPAAVPCLLQRPCRHWSAPGSHEPGQALRTVPDRCPLQGVEGQGTHLALTPRPTSRRPGTVTACLTPPAPPRGERRAPRLPPPQYRCLLGTDCRPHRGETLPSWREARAKGTGRPRPSCPCPLPAPAPAALPPPGLCKAPVPVGPANEGRLHPPGNWATSIWCVKRCL